MNKHEDFTYTLPSGRKYTFDQILKQEFHRQDKASLEGFQKHAINRGCLDHFSCKKFHSIFSESFNEQV